MRWRIAAAAIAEFIRRNVQEFNGTPEDPHSYDNLDKLLDAQVYRLSHWKAAADEINYRRFFDINELAAVCTEAPEVFAESHRLVFDLLVRGDVGRAARRSHRRAVRSDGVSAAVAEGIPAGPWQGPLRARDGARSHAALAVQRSPSVDAPAGTPPPWSEIEPEFLPRVTAMTCADRAALPLYVVVEKILGIDETLPEEWLLAGTTGYEFLNFVDGLFVDPAGLAELDQDL